MYCEKAQKECGYLETLEYLDRARLLTGIRYANVDPDGKIDNDIIETISEFNQQAVTICEGEDSCGAIRAAIVTSVYNSAFLKD